MIYKHTGRETITIDNTAGGKGLTSSKLTTNVVYALIQVLTAPIRETHDGATAPVANTTGKLFYPTEVFEVWGMDALKALRMIRDTASSGEVDVEYYGTSA